jgi:hypothetical protein
LPSAQRARLDELDLDCRKLCAEPAQDLGARLARAVAEKADPERAALPARQRSEPGNRLVRALHDLARVAEQELACRRQLDPACRPDEEVTPICFSTDRICAESAGCAMCSRSAARLKFSSSATARK